MIKHSGDLKFPLIILSLEDFLSQVEIFDEIIDGVPKIGWTLPHGTHITNSEDFFLINRVLSVPENLFNDFHPLDKDYALAEFRAYLMFAIEAFPLTLARPGPGGMSGNRFSLAQQWDIVQKSEIQISIPNYYLGNLKYSPFEETDPIVFSTPYNYYYWKPMTPFGKDEEINFCFSRPSGTLVVCSIIGEQTFVFPYFPKICLNEVMESKLLELGRQLANLFDYLIAECLFFVDGKKITFGMISNIPYSSREKDFFSSSLIQTCNSMIRSEAVCAF